MTGKTTWIIAICLAALSLMAASCASSPTTAPTAASTAVGTTVAPAPAGSPTAGATVPAAASPSAAAEAPKYGGTLNVAVPTAPLFFDQVQGTFYKDTTSVDLTQEYLVAGDWSVGPAGSKQTTFWVSGVQDFTGTKKGVLATNWKMLGPGHVVFTIRHGVHFALDPNSAASKLVNGREMTAADVVYSIKRYLAGNKYVAAAEPSLVKDAVVTSPDTDTVDFKYPPETTMHTFDYVIWGTAIVPHEVIEKYGDMNNPKNIVGTGPFMLTNYTTGSSIALVKNPNYWQKDPVGPGKGNKLPYIDSVNILILPDPSTRLTALRTAKIDEYSPLLKDDYTGLIKTSPQLKTIKFLAAGTNGVYMRVDKQDLPYKDVRVRQALAMAIDYKGIVSKLMGGDGEYPGFPTANMPDFKDIYFPLSDLPQATQDIYSYDPTKAKQLLAQAGYPNGFKASILVNSTLVTTVDDMSVFKDYWSKIGVDATLQPMENAAYNTVFTGRKYDNMAYGIYGSQGIYLNMLNWVGTTVYNGTWGLDPKTAPAKAAMQTDIANGDIAGANAVYKDLEKYEMGQVWTIPYPRAYNYTVWWPWLKNYDGETSVGYLNGFSWATFTWIDQGLKKSMGF